MKKLIIIPVIILIIGVCLALAGFAAGGMKAFWMDRSGFHLSGPGTIVEINETYNSFKNINADAAFLDSITIKEGDNYSVQGRNAERNGGIDVRLDGDTLVVKAKPADGRWFDFGVDKWFNWNRNDHGNYWIEITYPKGTQLGEVRSTINAGDARVRGIVCDTLFVNSDFGNVDVATVGCGKLEVNSNSGDVRVSQVNASGSVIVNNDFGQVSINGVTADSISAKLNSGDLSGSEFVANDLRFTSAFGSISFDRFEFTGHCEVNSNAGDVRLDLLMSEDDVSYELNTNAGDISVNGRHSGGLGSSVANRSSSAGASLKANVDFGSLKVNFAR